MGGSGIPIPDTSQLPDQSPANQYALQNANAAMQPQAQPPSPEQPFVQDQGGNTLAMGGAGTPEVGQPVAQAGPLKSLLTNFFGGMGRAMMVHAGLPTPEQAQQQAQKQAMQQQMDQSTIQYHQAAAENMRSQNEMVPYRLPDTPDGTPGETIQIPRKSLGPLAVQQLRNASKPGLEMATIGPEHAQLLPGVPVGTQVPKALLDKAMLGVAAANAKAANAPPKTPNEIALIQQALGPNAGPQATLDALQKRRMQLAQERGVGYAQGRALYTPFETVIPGTNIPTTISNMQALKTGAPKVSLSSQQKLGGNYALFNDAYGILDKVDQLADKVHLDDPGVSSRVAAGYAAIKDPAAKGLTGEILSNAFARQPIYNTLTPDERDLVLTMAQGKAAGTGLRAILGQAGTNEMQQRLDSALFPGGQTAASTAGLKSQTEATRQLLDRFIVGQPEAGLNAPGSASALRTRRGGGETATGVNLPPGAPAAPSADGKLLRFAGKVIAKSQGGKWVAP